MAAHVLTSYAAFQLLGLVERLNRPNEIVRSRSGLLTTSSDCSAEDVNPHQRFIRQTLDSKHWILLYALVVRRVVK